MNIIKRLLTVILALALLITGWGMRVEAAESDAGVSSGSGKYVSDVFIAYGKITVAKVRQLFFHLLPSPICHTIIPGGIAMSLTSFMVRTQFARNDKKRDKGLTTPADVVRFDDIVYGPNRKWQVLDVYRPRGVSGPLPVIVNVHGGGCVYGDKNLYQYYCMGLAQHGFAVVNFTYRLAPEYKFPAALEDTNLVFQRVFENAAEYGFDTSNIFAIGDSAGANYLGLYCCICTNPDYASKFSFKAPSGFCPKAVVLNCGLYHQKKSEKKDLSTLLMANLMPNKGTDEEYHLIWVDEHATSGFPPAFIMTCEGDFLAQEAPPFYEKLSSLGVAAEYHYYGDAEHVLGHVFQCNIRLPEAIECTREECEFLKRFVE